MYRACSLKRLRFCKRGEGGEKLMEDLQGCCKIEMQTESLELRKCSSLVYDICWYTTEIDMIQADVGSVCNAIDVFTHELISRKGFN